LAQHHGAENIRLVKPCRFRYRRTFHWSQQTGAGSVDQDVDTPGSVVNVLDASADRRRVGHIHTQGLHRAGQDSRAAGHETVDKTVRPAVETAVATPEGADDVVPAGGQGVGDEPAEAGTGPGLYRNRLICNHRRAASLPGPIG